MGFLKNSNLPYHRVRLCAVSADAPEIIRVLQERGIDCVPVAAHPMLPAPVASHPDMRLCHLGGNEVLAAREGREDAASELTNILKTHGFHVFLSDPPGGVYPEDVKLNCAVFGAHVCCNPKTVDRFLINRWSSGRKHLIPVAQGYTKCALCIVAQGAVITSDPSIAKAIRNFQPPSPFEAISVLEISPGQIRLEGYDTGFIGGCTGLLGPKLLAFTGSLDAHTDGGKIADFLRRHGVGYVELTKEPLFDIGSILPLKEWE